VTRSAYLLDLLRELVARDLKIRYRRSVLGIAWSQLSPLATIVALTFVFTRVVDLGIPDYALFVFTGLLAWNWFQGSVVAATQSVVAGGDLVRLPGFPTAMLPVAALIVATVVMTGRVPVTATALPVLLVVQFLFILGPALLLAAVNVRFRDTAHLVGVLLLPLFYVTPVFYDLASVPQRFRELYDFNPLAQLVLAYRAVLLHGRWPSATRLGWVVAVAAVLLVIGSRVFGARAHEFAEEL
jgi:lipopolysaccharide transport system permease protein